LDNCQPEHATDHLVNEKKQKVLKEKINWTSEEILNNRESK
jgi:hypothetical protein